MTETPKVVLVTGVSRPLGRRFARRLAADPTIERVIGLDIVPPRGDIGDVSFVRADIRNPVVGKIMAKADVDTVVHMSVIATPGSTGERNTMKELNVIGTMQLLAACQKTESLRRLIVKSTTTVYGASSRDPAMFTESMEPKHVPASGYAKDAFEVEGYVRGFARRRDDVRVTLLRAANVIGPEVTSPTTSYFRLPVVPTILGRDPRLQFLHETDLLDALRYAVHTDVPGTFNVVGDGVLTLSQAIRRLGKSAMPIPGPALGSLSGLLRSARLADFSPEQMALLTFGRGVDNTRMRTILGFEPAYSTATAFADFATCMGAPERPLDDLLASAAATLPSNQKAITAVPGGRDG